MSDPDHKKILEELKAQQERMMHAFHGLQKSVDDVLWYHRLGDVAVIDKVRITGPPPRNIPNPTAPGAGNPVVFWSYAFTPKGLDESKKYPLIVFPHGGVHANMGSSYAHIVGELIRQGYLVVARALRGVFQPSLSILAAYRNELVDPSERGRWMGVRELLRGVFRIPSPLLGGLLYTHVSP